MKKYRPTPWFTNYNVQCTTKKIIIIGAGISGASTAYSLAERGHHVIVYDKNPDCAMEASGNYQAMLYGTFNEDNNPMQKLSMLGYEYSLKLIHKLLIKDVDYGISGLCDLSYNDKEFSKNLKLLRAKYNFIEEIWQPKLDLLAGININCTHAILYPNSVWVKPRNYVKKLLEHPNITVICNTNIIKLEQDNKTQYWTLVGENNKEIDNAQCVVLCNAHAVSEFEQTKYLPLRKIRGQISVIPGNIGLKSVICSDTYITPSVDGYFCCGATFKFNDNDLKIRNSEHKENIDKMSCHIPQLSKYMKNISYAQIFGQANYRTSTSDYLPLVGTIAKYNEFITNYKRLELDSNYWIETPCQYHNGLFLNIGHGAKGILSAPICGEIIAAQIDNQNIVNTSLLNALHPNRLWLRQIIKHCIA